MKKLNWIQNWLYWWVTLFEGLFQVLTLGLINTKWQYLFNLKVNLEVSRWDRRSK